VCVWKSEWLDEWIDGWVCDKRYKRIVRVCRIPRGSRMIEIAAALIDERYPNDVRYYISGNYDNNLSFISVWIHGVRNNKSFAFSVIAMRLSTCARLDHNTLVSLYIRVCMYICIHVRIYTYEYICTCMCTYARTDAQIRGSICDRTWVYRYIFIRIRVPLMCDTLSLSLSLSLSLTRARLWQYNSSIYFYMQKQKFLSQWDSIHSLIM